MSRFAFERLSLPAFMLDPLFTMALLLINGGFILTGGMDSLMGDKSLISLLIF
jgi:hypothetical protein